MAPFPSVTTLIDAFSVDGPLDPVIWNPSVRRGYALDIVGGLLERVTAPDTAVGDAITNATYGPDIDGFITLSVVDSNPSGYSAYFSIYLRYSGANPQFANGYYVTMTFGPTIGQYAVIKDIYNVPASPVIGQFFQGPIPNNGDMIGWRIWGQEETYIQLLYNDTGDYTANWQEIIEYVDRADNPAPVMTVGSMGIEISGPGWRLSNLRGGTMVGVPEIPVKTLQLRARGRKNR